MQTKIIRSVLLGAALCTGMGAAQALTNFEQDVNAAITDGLDYARNNNWFANGNNGTGLILLALLEKPKPPFEIPFDIAGYDGLSPADKTRAQNAACILIDAGHFGDRGSFYSYFDGQVLMALAIYADTGGPDSPAGAGYNCAGRTIKATMDKVTTRVLATQQGGTGMWSYTGPGDDASTTQFTVAGLTAAKKYYTDIGDPDNKLPAINAALNLASTGYEFGGHVQGGALFTDCGAQGCKGHGYHRAGWVPSQQQTGSGLWVQLQGAGKDLNNNGIQSYLRWLYNAYNYETNVPFQNSWAQFYHYYLWSSAKGYTILENSGVAKDPGNIDTSDLGTLPAVASRLAHRDPLTDPRPAPRGAGGAGYYGVQDPHWYYDYAYTLMDRQQGNGEFDNPNGNWGGGGVNADHAYGILVLEGSIGGACVDTDGDGVCDSDDNCPADDNPGQEDADLDGVGDACDVCPGHDDNADADGDGTPDGCDICDIDDDLDVDIQDVIAIIMARNTPALPDQQDMDADGDGTITVLDARQCVLRCTLPGCASPGG